MAVYQTLGVQAGVIRYWRVHCPQHTCLSSWVTNSVCASADVYRGHGPIPSQGSPAPLELASWVNRKKHARGVRQTVSRSRLPVKDLGFSLPVVVGGGLRTGRLISALPCSRVTITLKRWAAPAAFPGHPHLSELPQGEVLGMGFSHEQGVLVVPGSTASLRAHCGHAG